MENRDNPTTGFSKRDLVYLLYKRRGQIVAVLMASLILTTAAAYLKARPYKAYATIYVERGAPPVATNAQIGPRVVLDRKEILNSEVEFMLSRAVIGKAADEMLEAAANAPPKVRRDPGVILGTIKSALTTLRATLIGIGLIDNVGTREGLIDALQSNIEAEPAFNSNIITVSFESDSPGYAAQVVNAVTRIYLEERLRLMKNPGVYGFYEEQIEISRAVLNDLEQQTRALKAGSDVVSGDEEIRLRLEELRDLDADFKRVQATKEELQNKLEVLEAQIEEVPMKITSATTLGRNPEMTDLLAKLATLRESRARDAQVYRAESQKMLNLDRSIAALEAHIARINPTVTVSEVVIANDTRLELEAALRQTEVEFRAASARSTVLASQIEALRKDLQRIDEHTAELNSLNTARVNAERTYLRYVEQQEEARISDATEVSMTNVDVIHYATPPERPKRPRIVDMLIGATLGLFMGIAFAFTAEFFDHSLENKDDVESALGLPLLASLPDIKHKARTVRAALTSLVGLMVQRR